MDSWIQRIHSAESFNRCCVKGPRKFSGNVFPWSISKNGFRLFEAHINFRKNLIHHIDVRISSIILNHPQSLSSVSLNHPQSFSSVTLNHHEETSSPPPSLSPPSSRHLRPTSSTYTRTPTARAPSPPGTYKTTPVPTQLGSNHWN